MQSQMFKEVTDDWIKITERTSLWAANYQASPTKPAYDGTDLADSAIAENDLASMLKFKRFQWSTILLEERFRFGAWGSRENGVALDGNGSGREKGVQLIATARLSELSLRLAPLLVS